MKNFARLYSIQIMLLISININASLSPVPENHYALITKKIIYAIRNIPRE